MTEIQWLVGIMMEHKLPDPVKQKFIARIGEVEAQLIPRSSNGRTSGFGPENGGSNPSRGTTQAPSMQKIIDETPFIPEVPTSMGIGHFTPPKPVAIDKETGRPMMATGKGTLGPRKF